MKKDRIKKYHITFYSYSDNHFPLDYHGAVVFDVVVGFVAVKIGAKTAESMAL